MKRFATLSLAALMVFSLLAGCSPKPSAEEKTPEELTELYKTAIEGARDQETNDALPVLVSAEDELADLVMPLAGFTAEDAAAFALSISPMNMRAYGIAVVRPAADKEETVKTGLENFITLQQSNFEMYLMDQYDIAKAARLETLEDGTILMVMCEDQDTVFDAIKAAVEQG